MTRIYISADLEGICGVVSLDQCAPEPNRSAYEEALVQLENELNVIVEAALDSDVTEIVVNDAHCSMTNIRLDELDPRVSLITGKPKRCAMVSGLNGYFDGTIFLGYHAKAGSRKGVLSHTFHHHLFDVSINGVSYGEGGINALYASLVYEVPLILASGDRTFIEEIRTLLPDLKTVETKIGFTQTAAQCHPLEEVLTDYEEKTRTVLEEPTRWIDNCLTLSAPYTLQMTFINSSAADMANLLPHVERLDGRTLSYTTDDFQILYQTMQSCYTILAALPK